MRTVTLAYLAVGFAIGVGLFGWAALSSVRRHGFRRAGGESSRTFFREELPLYPKVPMAAWLGIIAFPVLTIWATVADGFDVGGVIALLLLWLGCVAFCGGTSRRSHSGKNATV